MKIALIGHGVVGSGVVEVILKNKKQIDERAGDTIEIKYILDIKDFPDSPLKERFIKDFSVIENDPEIGVVVETAGGATFAYDYVKRALLSGKSVVTSNKELVAKYGYELLDIARKMDKNLFFEASVGGGIPIIRPLYQCLAANDLAEICGILNGTTNFILTKMIKENMDFKTALSLAQKNGYAEADPTADVEGIDACRKISILASLAFGKYFDPEKVYTKGITGISLEDVEYAEAYDCVIKLVGRTKKFEDGKVSAGVSPCFVSKSHPLSSVEGVFNGIVVNGNAVGECMFYGMGAGKLPTASAVVADIIDAVKHSMHVRNLFYKKVDTDFIIPHEETKDKFFVRMKVSNRDKARNLCKKIFKDFDEVYADGKNSEFALVTKELKVTDFNKLISEINNFDCIEEVLSYIAVL